VTADEGGSPSDLDRAAALLFPGLSPAERRARVEAVLALAQEEGRIDRIDRLAATDLYTALLSLLRRPGGPASAAR